MLFNLIYSWIFSTIPWKIKHGDLIQISHICNIGTKKENMSITSKWTVSWLYHHEKNIQGRLLFATPKQLTVIQLEHTVLTLRQSLKLCPRSLNNGAYQKRNITHFEVFRMNQQGPNSRSFPQKKITSCLSD